MQQELQKAYPDLPLFPNNKVNTFAEYAYAAHDQASHLFNAIKEMKSMHESHFMTKKNKELIRDKKALEEELQLLKSTGFSIESVDGVNQAVKEPS